MIHAHHGYHRDGKITSKTGQKSTHGKQSTQLAGAGSNGRNYHVSIRSLQLFEEAQYDENLIRQIWYVNLVILKPNIGETKPIAQDISSNVFKFCTNS